MSVKQLSIFAENRNGSIYEITKILADAGIALRAFSIADTQNYGVLRLIVNDIKAGYEALSNAGKIVNVTDVVGVEISDANGGLCELLHVLAKDEISVEYLYAFVAPTAGKAFVNCITAICAGRCNNGIFITMTCCRNLVASVCHTTIGADIECVA